MRSGGAAGFTDLEAITLFAWAQRVPLSSPGRAEGDMKQATTHFFRWRKLD